ncbi:DUF4870 domain-containing protein [Pseudalkalibacillus berkeleyi]|uniref:DUF4870 domain-containing protein n=1 Tax=Pseudalkalibacillus berkeleyi TaxID=1069813 RepID=A0ABS9H3M8_9BACL|nr:DUF4870 domain-containing protein [Pseudalkalibacillus berkeleyi]MCF6138706.1 DUF4870 domain-containing protein [Pseudalkalibacillus berkeleyi]
MEEKKVSSTCRVISSLSYMSIIFAPFLVPVLVYCFMNDDHEVREHARKAITFHLIPIVALAILSILYFESGMLFTTFSVFCMIIFGGTAISVVIWNLVRGIHVLLQK